MQRTVVDRVRAWKLRLVVTRLFPERFFVFFDAGCEYSKTVSSRHSPRFPEKAPRSIDKPNHCPCHDVSAHPVCTTLYYDTSCFLRRLPPPASPPAPTQYRKSQTVFFSPREERNGHAVAYECDMVGYRSTTLERLIAQLCRSHFVFAIFAFVLFFCLFVVSHSM